MLTRLRVFRLVHGFHLRDPNGRLVTLVTTEILNTTVSVTSAPDGVPAGGVMVKEELVYSPDVKNHKLPLGDVVDGHQEVSVAHGSSLAEELSPEKKSLMIYLPLFERPLKATRSGMFRRTRAEVEVSRMTSVA
ncbi:hypothetical protein EYF80_048884 [Liparis tanakae]|uniref:Uncharacterized protein n=1 Tax=Liparis tanakae TaxID=230148 RepID=A0A4Z2FJ05_9TELE|nr:hypothetical protein EYF80_048884 [Liparis tanakae]